MQWFLKSSQNSSAPNPTGPTSMASSLMRIMVRSYKPNQPTIRMRITVRVWGVIWVGKECHSPPFSYRASISKPTKLKLIYKSQINLIQNYKILDNQPKLITTKMTLLLLIINPIKTLKSELTWEFSLISHLPPYNIQLSKTVKLKLTCQVCCRWSRCSKRDQ